METKLYSLLSGTSAITAIVSTRIYPNIIPENSTFPAITYTRIAGGQINSLRGYESMENPQIQIDIWGTGYKGVKELAMEVHSAMDATTSFDALLLNDHDAIEQGADGEIIYRCIMDFSCMNRTTYI